MRDYSQGAFEALSWVKNLIEEKNIRCKGCQESLEEINQILERIQKGAAVDFTLKVS